MRQAGNFFAAAGLDSTSSAHVGVESFWPGGDGHTFVVPDAHLLFSGDFHRSGQDLIISDPSHHFVVPHYFHGSKRPTLVSPEGAPLDPKVIEALTGHVELAQAGGAPAGKVVGHIVKMTGSASVVRNGVTAVLNVGDVIYQNDVVQTGSGSTLGLVLEDGTAFNLTANARLMLNDLTYDASSTSNSSLITLVQGAASFVAGQVAKTGDMRVATPVAVIGVRGTAVQLDISSADGRVSVSVLDQGDGLVHAVQVYDTRGNLIGTVTSNSGTGLTLTPTATFEVIAQLTNKNPADVAREFNAFQSLLSTYDAGKVMFPNLPQHTKNDTGGGDNNTSPGTTKYAGSTPATPPATEFHAAVITASSNTGSSTPAIVVVTPQATSPSGGSGGSTSSTPTDTPTILAVNVTPVPFVVTPSKVASITSGSGDHTAPVMSASGDVVYDPDGIIYFYDRESGATIRVTPDDGRTYSGQTISSDGRYVVYQGTNGGPSNIYVWGTDPADSAHYHVQTLIGRGGAPAVSGDGSVILAERGGGIVIYDLQGHQKGTISAAAVGGSGSVWLPSISADGHIIAFWHSDSANPGGSGQLYAYDSTTAIFSEIATVSSGAGVHGASLSADGHYVVYQGQSPGGRAEIYLYDLVAGHVVFTTENTPEITGGASRNPVISPDGHYIIFTSDAQITNDDGNAFADTYVVDVTNPAAPVFALVSQQGNAASDGGVAISAGGIYVAFASNASFSGGNAGSSNIFVVDPGAGHSAIIQETANSPSNLTATGVIAITGGTTGVTLSVTDAAGNPTSLLSAAFNSGGNIQWDFSEAKSDFASLPFGQDLVRQFIVTMSSSGGTTTIPVSVTVHNAVQPTIVAVDAPPVAVPVTLPAGSINTTYVIADADLFAGVTDVDGPLLTITNVSLQSGIGSVQQDVSGNWVFSPGPNYNGAVVLSYTVSDGTFSASSTASLTIDGTAPNAPSISMVTDDTPPATGPLASGDSSNDTDLTVKVELNGTNAVAGDTVQLYNGTGTSSQLGTSYILTSADITAGFANVQTGPLSNGTTYLITARVTDQVGNQSAASGSFTVIEDTTPPTAAVAITAIATDSAPGGTNNDFITNDTTLTVSGTNGTLGSGEKVQISTDGGATWVDVTQSSGTWTYADPATHNTSFTYQVRVVDTAGNIGNTASQAVTIDTTAPTAVATVTALSSDTGTAGDFITSVSSQTVSGTYAGTLGSGEKIQVSADGSTWIDATASAGSFTASGVALLAGNGTLSVRTIDTAGNVTAGSGHGYTLDTTAPNAAVAITAIATDSAPGGTNNDFITNDTTLTVSGTNGTLGSGEKVQVSTDGVSWADVTPSTGTTWTYTDPATHNTSFTYQVRVVDTAGNVGNTASQAVTIDTTAPNAPSITSVTDDVPPVTGTLTSGGSTNDTDLTVKVSLSGTGAVAGDTVQLYNGTGTGSQLGTSYTLTATDIGNGFANVQTGTLTNGTTYTITARVSDQAGNQSGASGSFVVTETGTAPNAPSIASVTDDVLPVTGTLTSGGSTNDTDLTVAV
ncbi:MAG TPA: Ig-like domain-containing protein, partial [Bradyrhizobium sp.]|nr:Ig-like domain-containing protein [Bradyrhizobium sp.]